MRQNQPEKQRKRKEEDHSSFPGAGGGFSGMLFWIVMSVILALWLWQSLGTGLTGGTQISYSTFKEQLQAGNVERVTMKGERIHGFLGQSAQKTSDDGQTTQYREFVTYFPSAVGDDQLMSMMESADVEVTVRPDEESSWWPFLMGVFPFLLLLGVGYIFFRRMRSQGRNIFSIGQSRAKLHEKSDEETTFEDVAGAEGPKTELEEIVSFLKHPERFQKLGGEVPRGVLLVGPPGTGKTLLARAVAGEADVSFFSITGSDFMEMFVGVGASRVRDMFREAKEASPSIIFIDELDSIGRSRGAGLGGGHDEREQTLNQLLSELDGFEPNESVIVMAATNRPDILDKALLRPGRFDRRINVDMPVQNDREEILRIHARNKPLDESVDLERLARNTPGFSGADLKNLLNEAALIAARRDHDSIRREDVEEARDKIMMGLERTGLVLTDEERELLAHHEAGHALVAAVLPHSDPIHKVTIVPRGRAMGVTQQMPEREKYIYRREYMMDRLAVMMGGRAAEDLFFNTATSGAENDLKQVTKLARKMVLDWGMSDHFSNMALGGEKEQVFLGEDIAQQREYSETTAREVDQEVKSILTESYDRALNTIKEHRDQLQKLAERLLEDEEVPGEAVVEMVKGKSPAEDGEMDHTDQDGEEEEKEEAPQKA